MSKKKAGSSKPGVHGLNTGAQMGGPKFGQMQTPAKLASTKRGKGGRAISGKRR